MDLRQAIKRRGVTTRVLDRTYRSDVPDGRRQPDKTLMKLVHAIDPTLELIWHQGIKGWVLYRMVLAGVSPCDDVLIRVLVLDKPPGGWLVHWLQRHDITRGGALSLQQGADRRVSEIMTHNDAVEAKHEANLEAVVRDMINDMRSSLAGRKVLSLQTGKPADMSKFATVPGAVA